MKRRRRLEALWRLWRVRWARAQMRALRLFVRLVPTERQRVFALTILVGVLCGLAAVAFHLTIRLMEANLVGRAMEAPGRSWIAWTILTPTLGGMLGGAFGFLDVRLLHHDAGEVGAFALVGMGAAFAGIVRAPITSVLIIFEMTGSYGLILPLMISNMTAFGLARRIRPTPVYEALLEQDGIHLPHRRGQVSHALEQLRVAEAMTTELVTLPDALTVSEAVKHVEREDFSTFPVLDPAGRFVGLVSRARLRRTLASGGGTQKVRQLVDAESRAHVLSEDPLLRAVVRMSQTDRRQLAVLDGDDGARLVGLVTMSDVVRAHARAALGTSTQINQPRTRDVLLDDEPVEVEPARNAVEDVRIGGDGDAL